MDYKAFAIENARREFTPSTFALKNGVNVLANEDGEPMHFSGYARADRRAAELRAEGVNATAYESAYRRNLYYVSILESR